MRSLVFLFALMPMLAGAAECKFTTQRDFDVDAAGLKTVAFALGSTDVTVEGVPDLAKVEVRGKVCASEQASLADLTVDQQRSGDRVTITPHSRASNIHWFGSNYAYIALHVRMPAKLAVDIDGNSGDADVRNVAALTFKASSGDLRVDKIAGPLVVEVSSGDVKGGDIGSLDVHRTSSGDFTLRDVHGDVNVVRSGSGDLSFDTVGGSVSVGSVGSGDVSARHVTGNVSVDSIGSGDVNVDTVGGNFSVRAKGSGDVDHHDVRGKVTVPHDRDD